MSFALFLKGYSPDEINAMKERGEVRPYGEVIFERRMNSEPVLKEMARIKKNEEIWEEVCRKARLKKPSSTKPVRKREVQQRL